MTGIDNDKKIRDDNQRDFNAEIAGLSIGRIERFLSSHASDYIADQKNGKARERMSLLDILLLTDPRYGELYANTVDLIDDIDQAIAKTLKNYDSQLQTIEAELYNIKENANTRQDGTRVYLSESNHAYTEDGTRLSQEERQTIAWRDDYPSWEQYTQTRDRLERVRQGIEEVEIYRDTILKDAKDDIYNSDSPLDYDELQDTYEDIQSSMPDSVRNNIDTAQTVEQKSNFAQQFSTKMASATAETTEYDAAVSTETPAQENSGSSFLSNFSNNL